MAKDPIFGMDVSEEGAKYMLQFEHETLYFCSKACKESYTRQSGVKKPATTKGMIGRLLEKIAKETEKSIEEPFA